MSWLLDKLSRTYQSSTHPDAIIPANDGDPSETEDMTHMKHLEEPNVLACLDARFAAERPYTNIAKILIAVNPYQDSEIYTDATAKHYRNTTSLSLTKPHIWKLAETARRDLTRHQINQSIVCCGESGSGKTESTKLLMRYLLSGTHGDQIMATNPVAEAFGNSATLMNENSSRFAKFIRLHKNHASMETYLLERSRITRPPQGERNYHIFYMLCAACQQEPHLKKILHLPAADKLHYLSMSNRTCVRGVDDYKDYQALSLSMRRVGFDQVSMMSAFRIVASILHLGQVDTSRPDSETFQKATKYAADNLGLRQKILIKTIMFRNVHVAGKETFSKPLSNQDAASNRDALAKALYLALFNRIFRTMNTHLKPTQQANADADLSKWIGLLDVFGFESFPHNSYEQFCINFANECLQDYFNRCVIMAEQDEYRKENIQWTPVDVQDNSGTISMLSGKPSGVFSLLDSACIMPKNTASNGATFFRDSVLTQHRQHAAMKPAKFGRNDEPISAFVVVHYAGSVQYDCREFLVKNDDSLHPDVMTTLSESSMDMVVDLFQSQSQGRGSHQSHRFKSVGRKFSQQVATLIKDLEQTQTHFVRCVNPNSKRSSKIFDWAYTQPQIKCGGLLEVIRILKYGYPFRMPYTVLSNTFIDALGFSSERKATLRRRWICEAIMSMAGVDSSRHDTVQMGITKVFFRAGQHDTLDRMEAITKSGLTHDQTQSLKTWLIRRRWQQVRGVARVGAMSRRLLRHVRVVARWTQLGRIAVHVVRFKLACLKVVRTTTPSSLLHAPPPQSKMPVICRVELEPQVTEAEITLRHQVDVLQAQREEALDHINRLAEEREAAQAAQDRLEEELERHKSLTHVQLKALRQQTEDAQRKVESLVKQEAQMRRDLDGKDSTLIERETEMDILLQEKKQVEEQLKIAQDAKDELRQLLDQSRQQQQESEADFERQAHAQARIQTVLKAKYEEFVHTARVEQEAEVSRRTSLGHMLHDEKTKQAEMYETQLFNLKEMVDSLQASLRDKDCLLTSLKALVKKREYAHVQELDRIVKVKDREIQRLRENLLP